PSEFQAVFACRVCQGLDPAVIGKAAAIESHLLNARGSGAFGNCLANHLRSIAIAGIAAAFIANRLFNGAGRHQRLRAVRRHDLCVDVPRRAVHRQSFHPQVADMDASAPGAPQACHGFLVHVSSRLYYRSVVTLKPTPKTYFFFASLRMTYSSE